MKIKSLRLTNLQIHEERTFQFNYGLNIIIGDNNQGKSSIVRSLYWLVTNKPAGTWMQRFDPDGDEGERLTSVVTLELDSETRIVRIKGDKDNRYFLDDEEFTKVGRAVPDPILDAIGNTRLPNLQDIIPFVGMQSELPFMIFESGPTKGGLLNYLTGIDIADRMRKNISKESRGLSRDINAAKELIESHEEQLEQYVHAEDLDKRVKQVREKCTEWENLYFKIENLKRINGKLKTNKKKYKDRRQYILAAKKCVAKCERFSAATIALVKINNYLRTAAQSKQKIALVKSCNAAAQ